MDSSPQTLLQPLDSYFQANGNSDDVPDFPMFDFELQYDPTPMPSELIDYRYHNPDISKNFMDFGTNFEEAPSSLFHSPYEEYTKLRYHYLGQTGDSKLGSAHHTCDEEKPIYPIVKMSQKSMKISKKIKPDKRSSSNGRRLVTGTYQNIVKNYIKAIASFSTSDLALPYLIPLLDSNSVTQDRFVTYVFTYKEKVDSIRGLLNLTFPEENDDKETVVCKQIFKELSVIFLKYFAVNWIFGSTKLKHRKILLKNRFIIKKKLENPDMKVKIVRPGKK